MKKLLLIVAAAVMPALLCAQQDGMDKLIKKYENRMGVTVINLEGNIFEGVKHFLDSGNKTDVPPPAWNYEDYEIDESDDATILFAPPVVAEDAESTEEEVDYYAEYSDYDFGENDDYDYGYRGYGSGYGEYLDGFQEYLNGLTSVKVMLYENYAKKFPKDIAKMVVSKKPYKTVLSRNSPGKYVRICTIGDDGSGQFETLAIVGEGARYIVINISGEGDYFTPFFELIKNSF